MGFAEIGMGALLLLGGPDAVIRPLEGWTQAAAPARDTPARPAAPAAGACPPLLNHSLPDLLDKDTALCQFSGKVLLVVNTASRCGYTPQYEGLERLYRRYRDRGLVVLGFPSDDFGQELGSNKDVAEFCQANYGVSFPMFAKSAVARGSPNPFYAGLASRSGSVPKWNFHKYLVDRRGEAVTAYPSAVSPSDTRLVAEIERLLAAR